MELAEATLRSNQYPEHMNYRFYTSLQSTVIAGISQN